MTPGGLVIVGTLEIIVPLIVVLSLNTIPILATVLNLDVSILGMNYVPKVCFTLTLVVPQSGG
jgi:hypothetical protein